MISIFKKVSNFKNNKYFNRFGFDAGGSFSFLFGYNSQEVPSYASTINLYVCTDSQFTNLINYDPSLSAMLCNYRRCSFTYNLTDPRLSHEVTPFFVPIKLKPFFYT